MHVQTKRIERTARASPGRSSGSRRRAAAASAEIDRDRLVVLSRQALDRLVALARRLRPELEIEATPLDIAPDGLHGSATALARNLYNLRRRRTAYFDRRLFSDPAWDILLSLYLVECEGRLISVSAACSAAKVPQTTGLRWLRRLEAQGHLLREADRHDARRFNVRLSPKAFRKVHDLLAEAAG